MNISCVEKVKSVPIEKGGNRYRESILAERKKFPGQHMMMKKKANQKYSFFDTQKIITMEITKIKPNSLGNL